MKQFLDQNFLLKTKTAQRLYHDCAKEMPVVDYHCHLPPQQIAEDMQFKTLSEAWLYAQPSCRQKNFLFATCYAK